MALFVWAQAHGLVSLQLANKLALDEAAFRRAYDKSLHLVLAAWGLDVYPVTTSARVGPWLARWAPELAPSYLE